jgi:cell division septal protein FtsQ
MITLVYIIAAILILILFLVVITPKTYVLRTIEINGTNPVKYKATLL